MAQEVRKIIGLMSGTSADGVDAALVEVAGAGMETEIRLLGFAFLPFPNAVQQDILALCDPATGHVDRICRMHAVLGEWFSRAALSVCEAVGIRMAEVDLIGSHGQTIQHLPDRVETCGFPVAATLQIGDSAVIAERTGVTTVADFRTRDVAAGGQGAPLVPLVDFLLFRSQTRGRVMLNVGGIANLTLLPAGGEAGDVLAFDTGPGNMVIDAVVLAVTNGALAFDRGGEIASRGTVSEALLEDLMAHPFLTLSPPKSTGREDFGKPVVDRVLQSGLPGPDRFHRKGEHTLAKRCNGFRLLLPIFCIKRLRFTFYTPLAVTHIQNTFRCPLHEDTGLPLTMMVQRRHKTVARIKWYDMDAPPVRLLGFSIHLHFFSECK